MTLKRSFNGVAVPLGECIRFKNGKPITPDFPVIPFIEGDGIGKEISTAMRKLIDSSVQAAYGSSRRVAWMEVFAGDNARERFGEDLPADTLSAIKQFKVAIKGPLGTPTGTGRRSLNVALRQHFDLYQCVRPVRYFQGVPSVVKRPQDLNIVIFRENVEDVYAGIEFEMGSEGALRLIALLKELGHEIRPDSGIGIKPMSRFGSKRLVRAAIQYAVNHNLPVVTLVHKGNIQKFTEGAFRKWGYEVAKKEFGDKTVTEAELWDKYDGKMPRGKILINCRITDNMFCELLLKPTRFSVIATMNLTGDFLSDASAAQVGGLGIAPGANIGKNCAIFEATHGTAPDIAGKGLANPCSIVLSGVMMLEYLGWNEAAQLLVNAIERTLKAKAVTGDLARLMKNTKALNTSEFVEALLRRLKRIKSAAH
ncbi:MAG: isocitrate dehydrogenase (NADP(+)) [Candidatus Obscuribacterales bacterium]|nr:isocitrate dehydrogenase (NADP(+)) [Candidatus Obscuribacterales bacterium]